MPWPFDDENEPDETLPGIPIPETGYVPGSIASAALASFRQELSAPPEEPEKPGLLRQIGEGAMAIIGAPKAGVDWLARESAQHVFGLEVPEDATAGGMIREALLPADPSRGGLLDYQAKPEDPTSLGTLAAAVVQAPGPGRYVGMLPEGIARSTVGGAEEFAANMALDPITYMGIPGLGQTRGARAASKILGSQGEDIALYAPEVKEALLETIAKEPVKLGEGVVNVGKARRLAEKAAHRGFQAMMASGAVQGAAEAVQRTQEAGEFTPEAAEAATESVLSGLMLGAPYLGKAGRTAREAELGKVGLIRPAGSRPIDRLPDALIPEGEAVAADYAQRLLESPEVKDTSTLDALLPEHLRPHAEAIKEQAEGVMMAIQDGQRFLDKLRTQYGDEGQPGVETIPGEGEGNYTLLQRGPDGRIVGAANVDGDVVTFKAGGRVLGSPLPFRPVQEALDAAGAKPSPSEVLSPLESKARRREADRIMGRNAQVPEPAQPVGTSEQMPTFRTEAEPAYAMERLVVRSGDQDTPEGTGTLTRPGHLYRGMTSAEYEATIGTGKGIKSTRAYSHPSEGTSFAADAPTAEDYVNFGRDDPRKTGKPTYLVEIEQRDNVAPDKRDGYFKANDEVPPEQIRRVWRMAPDESGNVVAEPVSPTGPRYATEQRREVGPGFYSQLREVVDDPRAQATQRGADWLRYLSDPKRSVKADELEWTGLRDFLTQKGGERVTKREVQDFLDQNEVRVEEVTKDQQQKPLPWKQREGNLWFDSPAGRFSIEQLQNGEYSLRSPGGMRELFDTLDAARSAAEELAVRHGAQPGGAPKFQQWTTKGGKNYREVLLTLPSRVVIHPIEREPGVTYVMSSPAGGSIAFNADGTRSEFAMGVSDAIGMVRTDPAHPAREVRALRTDDPLARSLSGQREEISRRFAHDFTAGHWDEPNVLAHVRLADHVDADGKRVLLVEEIQSDWAQKGRKEGFRSGRSVAEIQKDLDAAYKAGDTEAVQRLNREALQNEKGHPLAPFVTDTSKWTDLALKRILKLAADEGYERIAILPGEPQANRYDLSKQISEVIYHPRENRLLAYDKRPEKVLDETIPPEKIADYIGKEGAERLLAAPADRGGSHRLAGIDLKVGGEGMRSFYDEIIPQRLNALAKKFGVKVQTGAGRVNVSAPERDTTAYPLVTELDSDRFRVRYRRDVREFPTRAEADAYAEQLNAEQAHQQPVHTIDLPESMSAQVSREGFPLFKAEGQTVPESASPMRDLLLNLYPENSHIREADGQWTVTLPNKQTVTWRPGQDAIEIQSTAFRKAYGREVAPGERAVGVTYRLPNQVVIDLVTGSPDRIALHEHWHAVKSLLGNLSEKQQRRLSKVYKTEEAEADAFAAWLEHKRPNGIFERIWAAIQRVYQFVTGAPEQTFREAQAQLGAVPEAGTIVPETGAFLGARNEPSYGTPTRDENFRRWFGQSKVVDEKGEPRTVYHGTRRDVKMFDADTIGNNSDSGYYGRGFYFSDSPETAGVYAKKRGEGGNNIMPVQLRIENPFVVDFTTSEGATATRTAAKTAGVELSWSGFMVDPERATAALRKAGHDGVIIRREGEPAEYVAFSPEQIKSATGNRGTFDPNNPDIRYAVQPAPAANVTPNPFPGVVPGEPLGYKKPEGLPPRVETKVGELENLVAEQKRAGLNLPTPILDRDTVRHWKDLDPEIRDKITAWDTEGPRILRRIAEGRPPSDVEMSALEAVRNGTTQAKDAALKDFQDAKGTPEEGAALSRYTAASMDASLYQVGDIRGGTAAGRALAIRGRMMEAATRGDYRLLRQLLRKETGLDDRTAAEIVRMWETGDPHLADALRAAWIGKSFSSKFWTGFRANLLGIPSEVANDVGNAIMAGVSSGDKRLAAGLDAILGRKTKLRTRHQSAVDARDAAIVRASIPAFKRYLYERGIGVYKRAWSGEPQAFDPSKPVEYQVTPFKHRASRLVWQTVLDSMEIGDQYARDQIMPGELAQRATELAIKRVGGDSRSPVVAAEAARIMAEITPDSPTYNPDAHADLIRSAKDSTDRLLFRDKPGKILQPMLDLRRRFPVLNLAMPFMTTPAKVTGTAIAHSPIGLFSPELWRARRTFVEAGKAYDAAVAKGEPLKEFETKLADAQGAYADVLAPRLVGTVIAGFALGAAKMGLLTGAGPSDPKEKQLLLATGWQPYSVVLRAKDGQKVYVPFNRFEPIAQVAGMAADAWELGDAKNTQDVISKIINLGASNFLNRTYMRGFIDTATALGDPMRFAGSYVSGIARAAVPRNIVNLTNVLDPTFRDTRTSDKGVLGFGKRIANVVASEIPGVSTLLPERMTATGELAQRPGYGVSRMLSPIQVSATKPGTELETLMAQLGAIPGQPRDTMRINGRPVKLEREDVDFVRRADRAAAEELRRIIRRPEFVRLPQTEDEGGSRSQEAIIRSVFQKYRTRAKEALLQNRDFRRRAREQLDQLRQASL